MDGLEGQNVFSEGQQGNGQEGNSGFNPAWNEFLEPIPQELHEKVTPILQKWDQGVQQMVQKVHSEYEPFKQFKEAGIDPSRLEFGARLVQAIEENPQMVYEALGQHYQLGGNPQGSNNSGQGHEEPPGEEDPYAARFKEIERQNEIMAQILLEQRKAQEQAEEDARLEEELGSLRKKFGNYDEEYVLSLMQRGATGEQAVQKWFEKIEEAAKSRVPKPLIMGGGGGIPNQSTDPRKLSSKDTNALVAQMLQQAAIEKNQ